MTLSAYAFSEHRTEAVGFLLMANECGRDVSGVADLLGLTGKELAVLLDDARAGRLERVPAAGNASRIGESYLPAYAIQPFSLTAVVASELAIKKEVSRARLIEIGRPERTSGAKLFTRMTAGLIRAGINFSTTPDGGIRLSRQDQARLKALKANEWRLSEENAEEERA